MSIWKTAVLAALSVVVVHEAAVTVANLVDRNRPLRLRDEQSRRINAAALMYAPNVLALELPGGIFLACRSVTPTAELNMAGKVMARALRERSA